MEWEFVPFRHKNTQTLECKFCSIPLRSAPLHSIPCCSVPFIHFKVSKHTLRYSKRINRLPSWFQMIQRSQSFTSWQELTRAVELEYDPSEFDQPRTALFKLTQTGLLQDYNLAFIALANRVTELDQEALLDCFISGLEDSNPRNIVSPINITFSLS